MARGSSDRAAAREPPAGTGLWIFHIRGPSCSPLTTTSCIGSSAEVDEVAGDCPRRQESQRMQGARQPQRSPRRNSRNGGSTGQPQCQANNQGKQCTLSDMRAGKHQPQSIDGPELGTTVVVAS